VARELMAAGIGVGGFRGRVGGNLPEQAGLSSSAALELAVAWALMAASGRADAEAVDRLRLALLCQRAENDFVGVNCGLMDQFAVSCGVAGHALLLDCRSLEHRAVALPQGIDLVVIQTGAPRRLLSSEYNERRRDCEQAVKLLATRGYPVASLRDVTYPMLDEATPELGEQAYRRCRHVLDENERTLATVEALEGGDVAALRQLFSASHASLRDLFEVSSPELDLAVDIAMATPGVIAARMTGAGFGGCTINLVERGGFERLRAAVEQDYVPRTGLPGRALPAHAAAGAGLVDGSAVA